MNKKEKLNFNIFRFISILAILCTIFLTIILCLEALKPGEKSSASSDEVSEVIKDNVEIKDNDSYVKLAKLDCPSDGKSSYVGQTLKINVKFFPENATDKALNYISSNPDVISVDEEGNAYFHKYGEVTITISSIEYPEIKTKCVLLSTGIEVETLDGVYPTFSTSSDLQTPTYEITEGTWSYLGLRNSENEIISPLTYSLETENPDILYYDSYKRFVALNEGVVTLKVTNKKTKLVKEMLITVLDNPEYIVVNDYNFKEEKIYIYKGDKFNPSDNIKSADPISAVVDEKFYSISCTNMEIFRRNNYTYTALALGEATFTITSLASKQSSSFIVEVIEKLPSEITILGNDRIICDKIYTYTAFGDSEYLDKVKWEVVSGDAEISASGELKTEKLGDIVIKATSLQNPELYQEYTIKVSLYESFGSLVRKLFGHFTAFLILGFGFMFSYLFIIRPKWLCPIISIASGVFVAALTETLQLPIFTENRGPSIKDVLLDSRGVLAGVLIANVIILLTLCLMKIFNTAVFNRTIHTLKKMNLKNILKKYNAID